MDIKTFKKALPVLLKCKITPLVVGTHGIGKSQCVKQAIEDMGGKVWDFRLGQMVDPGDLVGLLDINKNTVFCEFKQPKRIHDIIQFCQENPDKYGVMFLDEMNRTTKDVLQSVFQIVLDHELNGIKFPENLRCIAAINPATDDYDVFDFNDDAFADRFCHIKFEPTNKDWTDYARKQGIAPDMIDFIVEQPDFLRSKQKDFELNVKYNQRSWERLHEIEQVCPDVALLKELSMGMVGIEATTAYFEFKKNYDKNINALDILNKFKDVKKVIVKHTKEDREDIIRNVCDAIAVELEKVEVLSKKWEKNLVDFLVTIDKGLSYGFVTEKLFDIPCFTKTESDPDNKGLASGNSTASKKLCKHFEKCRIRPEEYEKQEGEKQESTENV